MKPIPTSPAVAGRFDWRAVAAHPLIVGLVLLLPVVWLLWPVPIDETRYLAVAWEMRATGEFLVPHLNGATYAHKPPLMFWLINAGWLVTGVHAWTARAIVLLCSLLSLLLLERLVLRLTDSAAAARSAMWFLLGTVYFAAFANAIMFDVLLTTCVLLAVHGIVDLVRARRRRGIVLVGVAIGLGILVKGPVMLLFVAIVGLGAPWWAADALRGRRGGYFGALGLALLLGAAIALAWAIPAAVHGGPAYARAIFLSQTVDRIEAVEGASTHARPWWWYGMVFPLMLLPWLLAVRISWASLRTLAHEPVLRLVLVWVVPTFLVFSMIGGKQPHYLLPVLPGVALGLAFARERGALRVQPMLFGLLLVVLGAVGTVLLYNGMLRAQISYVGDTSPWWGVALALFGLPLLVFARRASEPAWTALAMMAVVLAVKIAVVQGPGVRYDMTAVSAEVRKAQERGQPIAHLGWHHGVYEFAGRLTQPLLHLTSYDEFVAWAKQHPDGLVMSSYRRFRFRAVPVYTQPFRGVEVSIWKADEALASGIDPAVAHARDEGEESNDD